MRVRSPLRIVRPQTSQLTVSLTPLTVPALRADSGRSLPDYRVSLSADLFSFASRRDHLLGQVAWDLLVALELHRVVGAAAADRAQVGGEVQDLRHRDLGLDLGHR